MPRNKGTAHGSTLVCLREEEASFLWQAFGLGIKIFPMGPTFGLAPTVPGKARRPLGGAYSCLNNVNHKMFVRP